jgi:hypothetical protein
MSESSRFENICIVLLVAAGLLVLSSCSICKSKIITNSEEVVVKVNLRGRHDLMIEIENNTSYQIELDAETLPWIWRYGIWIKAFEDDAIGSSIEEKLTIADLPFSNEKVILLPHKSLSGSIDLRERFPEIQEALKGHNVVIFWNYIPRFNNGTIGSRHFGSFVIQKLK